MNRHVIEVQFVWSTSYVMWRGPGNVQAVSTL